MFTGFIENPYNQKNYLNSVLFSQQIRGNNFETKFEELILP